jgi:exonuclease SbcC
MLIKKIKLDNIRSYKNEEINFPNGSILLAGDIGSGKSTILLSLDFALFGLRTGELSGASLLRNGSNEGLVELHFTIEDKDVIIQRRLKRNKDSISQDSGYILINNERKDLSPIELKQEILNILNYPKELLTKSKSLIYKYTVYTPQEEMKNILLGEKDIRLDILRKVFDIDKYKRIKDNNKIFILFLKQKKKELEGKIYDLDDKNKLLNFKKRELLEIEIILKELIPKITEINKLVDNKKNEVKLIEENVKLLNDLKKELELSNFKMKTSQDSKERYEKELSDIILKINLIEKEDIKLDNIEETNNKLLILNNELSDNKDDLLNITKKINENETKKIYSLDIKNKINSLDVCPLCKKEVDEKHKQGISLEENNKIINYESEIKELNEKKILIQEKIDNLEKDVEKLKELRKNYELNKLKLNDLNDKINKKEALSEEIIKANEEISLLNIKINELSARINEFKIIDYNERKNELEELLKKEKDLEIKRATYLVNINELNKNIEILNKEVEAKLLIKKHINKINDIQFWLEEFFINVVELIEKQVMLKVHKDFNELFKKWFNMLMENENFNVKLDEEFSPLIMQNGHDIDYLYLSGGEKTATALAYRLALNQVINNLMTLIKTKDLLILDEPTDGFSDEQLDRVRNVLSELNIKQLILVSHEQKIESFADNVIRLNKEQHVTKVIS